MKKSTTSAERSILSCVALWQTNSSLRKKAEYLGRAVYAEEIKEIQFPHNAPNLSDEDAISKGVAAVGRNWSRNGFNFVPLVTGEAALRCSLDILFLRTEESNYIVQGGDIDGRLKTLFDSLRMIRYAQEFPRQHIAPGDDEEPFFVLLEDDNLISEVRVNANQLLLLPGTKTAEKDDVYQQITVQLNPTVVGFDTWIV